MTVEAIGCGCPVVISDVPAVADVVDEPDLRVPPRDPEALANAIMGLLGGELEARLGTC